MDIWDRALGFMDSQILLTAEELGVFAVLDERPRTVEEIAAAIELSPQSTQRLLTALCGMELIRKSDGAYSNSQQATDQLVPGKPGYIGGMFRHLREDLYPVWRHFKHALRDEQPQWERDAQWNGGRPRNEVLHEEPQALRAFMEGMHTISYEAGRELVEMAPELAEIRTLTDIGGAAGSFLIALAQHLPELRGTLLDLPPVRPIAEEFIRAAGLSERLTFQPVDFFTDTLPSEQDAYSLGFILHDWDTATGTMLLNKIAEASRPGAWLIIGEYLLNNERTGPHYVARMDLNMLVAARGRERSSQEYRQWIEDSGFALQQIYHTSQGKAFLMARCD